MARNDPMYKLVYFDLRGLGETARYIFAYANVEYEDCRLKREDWPTQKKDTPFHSLPYLEVDGEIIGQSNAIFRLLAKRFNLAGHDDMEQARVDALVDYISGKKTRTASKFHLFFVFFVFLRTPTKIIFSQIIFHLF
jgi:prostaglandin-H2 D-isomerase / glutathione transferase